MNITNAIGAVAPPDLFVGVKLADGSIRYIPVERALSEERLRTLIPEAALVPRPLPVAAAPQADRRREGVVVLGVDSVHLSLRQGDEFETSRAFARAINRTPQHVSNALSSARMKAQSEPGWAQATVAGVTFMRIEDYLTMVNRDVKVD